MKATNTPFKVTDLSESVERIDVVLDAVGGSFEARKSIPAEEELTFDNGFYVDCTAIFIDIRGSSNLTKAHTRPVLSKLYRAYTSEAVAVINSDPGCRHVAINGDCVSGYISTPYKSDIKQAFETAAKLNSMVAVLNWKLAKKGYTPIRCGIGLDYGTALMVKAGYKGVAINEIAWMGDVVNQASNLCNHGNKNGRSPMQVSTAIRDNLTDDAYKRLLAPVYGSGGQLLHYEGNAINVAMDRWLNEAVASERNLQDLIDSLLAPTKPADTIFDRLGLFTAPPPVSPSLGLSSGLFGLGLRAQDPTERLWADLGLISPPPAKQSDFHSAASLLQQHPDHSGIVNAMVASLLKK